MNDHKQPGGTGVDEHGVLLRSKPDPNEPPPDAAILADDGANLLYMAGSLANDPAVLKRVWQQLGLADGTGTPTPRLAVFMRAHAEWQKTHQELVIQHLETPAKAKAYAAAHLK